jgi:hypothetical protein
MSSITWSTRQWTKISCHLHFPFPYQHLHHLPLFHSLLLPNSPARYEDVNPEPLRLLKEEDKQPTAALPCLCLIVSSRLRTAANFFGLLHEYLYRPSFDPDSFVPEEGLHRARGTDSVFILPPSPSPVHRNESVEMNWKESGTSTKSDAEVNCLVNGVLLDPYFKLKDLQGFNVVRENQWSDAAENKSPFSTLFKRPTSKLKFHRVPAEYHQPHFLFQDWSIGYLPPLFKLHSRRPLLPTSTLRL